LYVFVILHAKKSQQDVKYLISNSGLIQNKLMLKAEYQSRDPSPQDVIEAVSFEKPTFV